MDNRVESNKALKAHPVESNTNGGLVVRNQSGFSTIIGHLCFCNDIFCLGLITNLFT